MLHLLKGLRTYNEEPSIPLILDLFFLRWNHGAESLLLSGGPLFPPGILLQPGGALLRRGMVHRSLNHPKRLLNLPRP
jgi:hypothetical protein